MSRYTVGNDSKTAQGKTTYFLWQQNQLVAEINADGKISTQYLYFNEGQTSTPIAKLDADDTYFIHTDHHAVPIAMTDTNQHIVWKATISEWGRATFDQNETTNKKQSREQKQVTLNIRLPGQYYDEETGLHDNWHRTYNPGTGRYLQPDPIGYRDGPDAYLYAQGDPLNKIDPTGLSQEDMHYYMVFFLALASGMDYTNAKITALASQYVDNNPITRPVDDETMAKLLESPLKNQQQLKWYHFTLSDDNGHTIKEFDNSDVGIVNSNLSPQLKNLYNAVSIGNPSQPCAKYQFLGEFLHAYADTFSHRDGMNRPIDALTMGLGVGHGLSGEQPDYTYNGDPNYTGTDPIVIAKVWNVREERSLAAERAILGKLKDFSTSNAVSSDEIDVILKKFNAIREHGEDSPDKKKLLQETLNNWI